MSSRLECAVRCKICLFLTISMFLPLGISETSREPMFAGLSLEERIQSLQSLPAFQELKDERKTQKEKERESLTARLRKEFGLSDDEDDTKKGICFTFLNKTVLHVQNICVLHADACVLNNAEILDKQHYQIAAKTGI